MAFVEVSIAWAHHARTLVIVLIALAISAGVAVIVGKLLAHVDPGDLVSQVETDPETRMRREFDRIVREERSRG